MNPATVLFFGSQGAGKGTQVRLLIEYLKKHSDRGVIHIDMGQLLRDMVAGGGHSAELTEQIIGKGLRMPDFMPIFLQTNALVKNFTGEEHIIADGLARGGDQTRGWDDAMAFYGRADYSVVAIELSESSSVKRLLARGLHDDTEEAIRTRLGWHKTQVEPQLAMLAERGRTIHRINGEPDIETIHKNILSALGLS